MLQPLKIHGSTIHRADYLELLLQESQRLGAKIMLDSEVIDVDSVKRQAKLKSGELVDGKVIVGADGENLCLGLCLHNGCIN